MSLRKFERFTTALRAEPALADGHRSLSTTAEVAERMRRDGCDVTDAEVGEVARIGAERAAIPVFAGGAVGVAQKLGARIP